MRNRSQNVTGEKVRSQKGRKPAPDRQKEAGESPDKKGERMKLSQFVGAGAGAISMAGRCCPGGAGRMGAGGGGMLSAAGLFQKPWWVVLPHARKRGKNQTGQKLAPNRQKKGGKGPGKEG